MSLGQLCGGAHCGCIHQHAPRPLQGELRILPVAVTQLCRPCGRLRCTRPPHCAPLLQAAVLGVPFVDVIATMSDPALPATVTEYEVIAFTLLILSCIYLHSCTPVSQQCLAIQLIAVHSSQHQVGLYLQSTLCGR